MLWRVIDDIMGLKLRISDKACLVVNFVGALRRVTDE